MWYSEKINQKVIWGVLGDNFKRIIRKISLVFKYSLIAVKMNIIEIFSQNINTRKRKEPRQRTPESSRNSTARLHEAE